MTVQMTLECFPAKTLDFLWDESCTTALDCVFSTVKYPFSQISHSIVLSVCSSHSCLCKQRYVCVVRLSWKLPSVFFLNYKWSFLHSTVTLNAKSIRIWTTLLRVHKYYSTERKVVQETGSFFCWIHTLCNLLGSLLMLLMTTIRPWWLFCVLYELHL